MYLYPVQTYSPSHERANFYSHLAACIIGLVAFPLLFWHLYKHGQLNQALSLGLGLYSLGFFMVFGFSAAYHKAVDPEQKLRFKMWDHIAIYWLIAGTFTPYIIYYGSHPSSINFLLLVWGIALAGTAFKVFYTGRFKLLSTGLYLLMGWMIVLAPAEIIQRFPHLQWQWIAAGGVAYSVGVIFYLFKRIPYHHAIWHVFVMAGAFCHFTGIWLIA